MEKNMLEMPKVHRELITQYREYNEDKDQGGHKYASLMKGLSKIVGSQDPAKIERWIVEQERKYGLAKEVICTSSAGMDDLQDQTYLQSQMHIKQIIAEATDPDKKAFFERLLKLAVEEDRMGIQ
jgi:hypothetical protein